MKKLIILVMMLLFVQPSEAFSFGTPENAVKKALHTQIKYANAGNFDKFIATYTSDYVNADGFNLDVYSKLVKDIWDSYSNLKYGIKIKNISVDGDKAKVDVTEYTSANVLLTQKYNGVLNSESESVYYLKKINGKWKVYSDSVLDETTTMLYGEVRNIDIKLTVPEKVDADTEYTASLEFVTPKNMVAIASITADKVEYPQNQSQEVFRAMPEDNILERLFTANTDSVNEYVVASIGLTQTDICDLSIKMSLTGFGYVVRRVNVVPSGRKESADEQNK